MNDKNEIKTYWVGNLLCLDLKLLIQYTKLVYHNKVLHDTFVFNKYRKVVNDRLEKYKLVVMSPKHVMDFPN